MNEIPTPPRHAPLEETPLASIVYAALLSDATEAAKRLGEHTARPDEAKDRLSHAQIIMVSAEHTSGNAKEIAEKLAGCAVVLFELVDAADIKKEYQDDLNRILHDPNDFTVFNAYPESVVRNLSPDTLFVGLVDIDEETAATQSDEIAEEARMRLLDSMYKQPYEEYEPELIQAIDLAAHAYRGREDHTFRQIYEFIDRLPRKELLKIGIVQGATHSRTYNHLWRAKAAISRQFAVGQTNRERYILHGYFERAARMKTFKPDKQLSKELLKRAALNLHAVCYIDLFGEPQDQQYNMDLFVQTLDIKEVNEILSGIYNIVAKNHATIDTSTQVRLLLSKAWHEHSSNSPQSITVF